MCAIHEFTFLGSYTPFQGHVIGSAARLRVVARGPAGEARAIELPGRRFFLATLFQPQLSSTPERPHPVIVAYLEAAAAFKRSGRET